MQINVFACLICGILFAHHKQKKFEVLGNQIFERIMLVVIGINICSAIGWLVEGQSFPLAGLIGKFFYSIYFVLQIFPCEDALKYGLKERGEVIVGRRPVLFKLPVAAGVAIMIANWFVPIVFFYDEANHYTRVYPGYLVITLIPVCFLVGAIVLCMRNFKSAEGRRKRNFFDVIVLMHLTIAGVIVQFFFPIIDTMWMLVTVGIVYVYVNVQSRREEKARREVEEAQLAIMLSQIQPHFLFNTLTGIARLCDKNPKLAKKATIAFSDYLRVNLDSIKMDTPISFEKELRHTQTYLSLEKMRFDDELMIDYDIETTYFEIPALTLQPLVENAVRHGVGKAENGGKVTVRTREYEEYFEVSIIDDGVGFLTETIEEEENDHVGIAGVRNRLRVISRGELEITSSPGKGTTAIIRLPKEV